jgi:hypothetical protein
MAVDVDVAFAFASAVAPIRCPLVCVFWTLQESPQVAWRWNAAAFSSSSSLSMDPVQQLLSLREVRKRGLICTAEDYLRHDLADGCQARYAFRPRHWQTLRQNGRQRSSSTHVMQARASVAVSMIRSARPCRESTTSRLAEREVNKGMKSILTVLLSQSRYLGCSRRWLLTADC